MLYYASFDGKVKSSWDSGKIWNWIQEINGCLIGSKEYALKGVG